MIEEQLSRLNHSLNNKSSSKSQSRLSDEDTEGRDKHSFKMHNDSFAKQPEVKYETPKTSHFRNKTVPVNISVETPDMEDASKPRIVYSNMYNNGNGSYVSIC